MDRLGFDAYRVIIPAEAKIRVGEGVKDGRIIGQYGRRLLGPLPGLG